jgi:uncharacterized protein (DUF1501 family)
MATSPRTPCRSSSRTSRRAFLRQAACSAVGYGAVLSSILDLHLINAAAQSAPDYKALVCLFLFGGNDACNMVVPAGADHAAYATSRGVLALPQDGLLAITPATSDGRSWALHPSLAEVRDLFAQRRLAVVANVGSLVAPVTRADYLANRASLPPQLFSHSDQQVQWQTSVPAGDGRTGWGGRTADLLRSLNGTSRVSMSISVAGTNRFQVGAEVFQYQVSTSGSISLSGYRPPPSTDAQSRAIDRILQRAHTNIFENAYRDVVRSAIDTDQLLVSALAAAPALATVFPTTSLGSQLRMIARLIGVRRQLGHNRQIFFCSVGGYDTHTGQLTSQANLFRELSQALSAFDAATAELGVADRVTTFTASDFGRTYATNGQGSDHGWGGHQLVMGAAVEGGDVYGRMPVLAIDGPDDTRQGRWIPTTSVDEYSATLARWFGVSDADLRVVLPNLGRFTTTGLGFLQ